MESRTNPYSVWNVPSGVISAGLPALVGSVAAPRTSVIPSSTLTNVGFARRMAWIWV